MAVGDKGSDPSVHEIRLGDPKGNISIARLPVRQVAEIPPPSMLDGDARRRDNSGALRLQRVAA